MSDAFSGLAAPAVRVQQSRSQCVVMLPGQIMHLLRLFMHVLGGPHSVAFEARVEKDGRLQQKLSSCSLQVFLASCRQIAAQIEQQIFRQRRQILHLHALATLALQFLRMGRQSVGSVLQGILRLQPHGQVDG